MEWQDGVPLTARDVAFTYNLDPRRPGSPAYIQYLIGRDRRSQAPDDVTVVITTRAPQGRHAGASPSPSCRSTSGARSTPTSLTRVLQPAVRRVGAVPGDRARAQGSEVTLEPNPAYPQALGGPPAIDDGSRLRSSRRTPHALLEDYTRRQASTPSTDFPATMRAGLRRGARRRPRWPRRPSGSTSSASTAGGARGARGTRCSATRPIRRAVHWAIDEREDRRRPPWPAWPSPARSVISPAQSEWHWEVPDAAQLLATTPSAPNRSSRTPATATATRDGVREDAAGHKLSFRLGAAHRVPGGPGRRRG